jgi:hypothetical protein
MSASQEKKTVLVRKHLRRVPKSKKNPKGITSVKRHQRRAPGSTFTKEDIRAITKSNRKNLVYPVSNRLLQENADEYDELIAVWVDFFNGKLTKPPMVPFDPNVFKALLASESDFREDPKENGVAIGIAQVTPSTLKILQDPDGEAKEFIFKNILKRDLKDPEVAIPLAVRWLFKKREAAQNKLKRVPTSEEVILEYKGLLRSESIYKNNALKKFRKAYEQLTEK